MLACLIAGRRPTGRQFAIALAIAAVPVAYACWLVSPLSLSEYPLIRLLLLLTLVFVVSCFPVKVSSERISLSTILPITMATNYLYGPFAAIVVSVAATLAGVLCVERLPREREQWQRLGWSCLFNGSAIAVSAGLPCLLYTLLLKLHAFALHSLGSALVLSLAAVADFYLNAAFVATIACLATGMRWDVIWYNNYRWTYTSTVLLSPLGFIMGALTEQNLGYGFGFILVPLFAIHQGYARHERQMATYRQGIDMLGRLMQESHPYTHGHLNRVAAWAVKIAERLNLPPESMTQIENAAILHDIGKVAIDDRILNKVEKLTDDEWAKIKEHPVVGAEIAAKMKYLGQVSLWIRHHHERIDGKGYPDGLSGDDIPVESKIICVVDAFDAMVGGPSKADQRPYRLPKTMEEARAELIRCSGTQFDERVVNVFLTVLDDEMQESASRRAAEEKMMSLVPSLGPAAATVVNACENTSVRLRSAA